MKFKNLDPWAIGQWAACDIQLCYQIVAFFYYFSCSTCDNCSEQCPNITQSQ